MTYVPVGGANIRGDSMLKSTKFLSMGGYAGFVWRLCRLALMVLGADSSRGPEQSPRPCLL